MSQEGWIYREWCAGRPADAIRRHRQREAAREAHAMTRFADTLYYLHGCRFPYVGEDPVMVATNFGYMGA